MMYMKDPPVNELKLWCVDVNSLASYYMWLVNYLHLRLHE